MKVLHQCISPTGLKASGQATGHHQVWARDTMITLLGARLIEDATINSALLASIDILRQKQTATGAIPNNVDAGSQRANFRAYADSGLWWVIGSSLMQPDREAIAAVLRWYACQDVDQTGLISMQEAADWQDLFCTRGKGLYVNCLYVWALRAAGQKEQAEAAANKINQYFWYKGDGEMLPHVAHNFSTVNVGHFDSLGRKRWLPVKKYLVNEQYYLPYLGFRAVGEWFDTLGNLLAILTDVADPAQSAVILDFIDRHQIARYPIRSLTPVIQPGDTDWRDYYAALNSPNNYHNGGIWPFIGGFYVAALVKVGRLEQARAAFDRLTELNRIGEFNEWHQAETAEPLGVKAQAWSAGMYLFAAECIAREKVLPEWLGFTD